jgi:phosphoribosylglycinamide formyltransferase 1
MHKIKLAIMGSTRGSSMQPLIDAIASQEFAAKISVVLSNKVDAAILGRARSNDFPAYSFSAWDEALSILNDCPVDLIVLIGFMKIIPASFIAQCNKKIINVHPSLLPKHGGLINLSVHQAVLDAGEKETGCSVHFVDEGIDTGDVVIQKTCPVFIKDDAESLKKRVQPLEGPALIEAIQLIHEQGFHYE